MSAREAMQRALDALEMQIHGAGSRIHILIAWNALNTELAKPEHEPEAWIMEHDLTHITSELFFKRPEGWNESWRAVPLYRKDDL
jgi:hypothetical protein